MHHMKLFRTGAGRCWQCSESVPDTEMRTTHLKSEYMMGGYTPTKKAVNFEKNLCARPVKRGRISHGVFYTNSFRYSEERKNIFVKAFGVGGVVAYGVRKFYHSLKICARGGSEGREIYFLQYMEETSPIIIVNGMLGLVCFRWCSDAKVYRILKSGTGSLNQVHVSGGIVCIEAFTDFTTLC